MTVGDSILYLFGISWELLRILRLTTGHGAFRFFSAVPFLEDFIVCFFERFFFYGGCALGVVVASFAGVLVPGGSFWI